MIRQAGEFTGALLLLLACKAWAEWLSGAHVENATFAGMIAGVALWKACKR